jgi:polysaccharide pyruvyl transferase WcaK-like protein
MSSKTVWLHGSAFGENFGDVLLLDIYRAKVEGAGYRPVFPFSWPETLARLNADRGLFCRPKRVLFCGGGYFGEPSAEVKRWSRRFRIRHYPAILSAQNFAREAPFAIGIGYGPISDHSIKGKIVRMLSGAEVCLFRDEQSLDLFRKDGGSRDTTISVTTDMVVSLSGSSYPVPDDFPKTDKKVVLFHLVDNFSNPSDFNALYSAALHYAKEQGNNIFALIIADGKGRAGSETSQDRLAKKLEEDLRLIGVESARKRYISHWDLVGTIYNSDFVITTKLHVGIVGAVLGISVCSIPYHLKTTRFYSQIEEKERCFSGKFSQGDIIRHIDAVDRCPGAPVLPAQVLAMSKVNIEKLSLL